MYPYTFAWRTIVLSPHVGTVVRQVFEEEVNSLAVMIIGWQILVREVEFIVEIYNRFARVKEALILQLVHSCRKGKDTINPNMWEQ